MTLDDETLVSCRRNAERHGVGFHVHVAEDAADQEDAMKRSRLRVIERLEQAGVLDPKTLCVHGVHLDERELEILAASRAWLVHCPQSNMNNAVGAADLRRLRDAGVRLALGTDGFTASVCREALCAHLLQSHRSGDPRQGYAVAPGLLFDANARLASEAYDLPLGRIESGAPADLVVWDYQPATPLTDSNLWGHLMFGLVNARATDVFVAGDHVLAGGRSTRIDEEELRRACVTAAARLWQRL
jgi:cytosine/adenosine deaminase-related metal-dependent hydrolase